MALSPLHLLLLHDAMSRSAAASAPAATTTANQAPTMPNQFEFLDKHYDPTDIPEVAAQTAYERFGNYPNAHTSTVIFGVTWGVLTDSIKLAVLNYVNGGVPNTSAYATLSSNGLQWNIVLTGLRFVNASRTLIHGRPEYQLNEYANGSIFVNAEALGGQLLGEVVHLENGFGSWVKEIKLKNQ